MARIGGRNSVMAWVVGLGCAAVVAVLVALAMPALPAGVQLVGDTLRAATSAPEAAGPGGAQTTERPAPATTTPECQALYTESLWAQLTQRVGGDPVQDASAPAGSAERLTAALAPQVRVTCVFTAINTGRIATTVSDVSPDADAVAEATLRASGFACAGFGDGVRCVRPVDDGVEEHAVRDGVWVATQYAGWRPDRYLDRIGQQLWPH